ncbi:uncharacterized protein LOC105396511 [Plutella xylostella]|uniref:uncharacterized protein LOC105396511 n=1 Tax=Plutella xylostella TaxID=51655 RepID=UPI0020329F12|nr:uncharacterized protein LOC105396511 [Plutella xylostella]XP_048479510.1 uncharacterized protein LOC105396511 [Plutella xylostella]
MERKQCNLLQNFDEPRSEILKKRLLKTVNISAAAANLAQNSSQQNVLLNTIRAPISSSMIVSSVQAPQSSLPITHNLVTHSIAPVKIHTNNSGYPLHLSTVHVPVQIPGSASNINVPVQLSGAPGSVPLHLGGPSVSVPLQVSGTTSVPVQLSGGDTISVPLQIPSSQSIHLTGPGLPSMPILQNANQQLHSSIIHVHMGSNPRTTNLDGSEMNSSNSHLHITDSNGVPVKMTNQSSVGPMQVQIPNSSNNSIQLTLPNSGNSGAVQLRGAPRSVPHVVYIQTPSGLKPVTSTEVISQASSSGNPPQIIVRRPVTSSGNIHLISNVSNKTTIGQKMSVQNKSSLLAPNNVAQPIVIQKPKSDKMMVPVSIATGGASKQAIAYLGPVKKSAPAKLPDNHSILLPNNHPNINNSNQKVFLTPMNMPKVQNKYILPVTLPATMASKGPIINLQIANGQIQNDPQGNITVMRDPGADTEMPPLQPLGKQMNGKEHPGPVPQSPKSDKSYTVSIPGSRVESTGEQEYSLSIPETNASMNDDIYTVSIADEDGAQREKSFTLSIPEKGKSLLNKGMQELPPAPAPAILRRSNSDNTDRKIANANLKRRISLCAENLVNKNKMLIIGSRSTEKIDEQEQESDPNDDHRVPSLFCDEQLDKELDPRGAPEPDPSPPPPPPPAPARDPAADRRPEYLYYPQLKDVRIKRESVDPALDDDPPGLAWSDGVARLRGSRLQFQTNEFGLIDLIDDDGDDAALAHAARYQTPLKQRIDRGTKKPTSPEDLYRCDGCGCHGMAAEFITPNYCSLTCQTDVQKLTQKKRDRERIELAKKRNKIKKLLMRKQLSDSDLQALIDSKEDKVALKHYDSLPADGRLSEATLTKMSEELVENEKYPWMCGKNGFSWMRYLEFCKAKAAPVKLFKDPFPYTRNGFKVSMRLEAIDPQHPSLFCVVSVAEVQGFRLRLHFDEYPDMYDFWVNADSADMFPAGWCDKNGRALQPPGNFSGQFSWPLYLKQMRAVAAPRHLFPHVSNTMIKPNGFRTGMKLEAEDRKNNLVCVATVADMMDHRLLVNFDSWDEMYDCWVEPSSPYIHPVGWAEENGISLTPPNFYKDPDSFSWDNYLIETGAVAAPARAFKTRPPQGFKIGMKLEVVDRRVPFLIRVATISEVKGHQVLVSFDGWGGELACWMDDDSPDIHPVGWCLKTGHPLEPPLTEEELQQPGPCGVGGCRGLGSLRGGAHKQHAAASACPYRPREPPALPPRRAPPAQHHALPLSRKVPSRPAKSIATSTPTSDVPRDKPRGRPPKHKRIEEVTKTEPASDDESLSSARSQHKRYRRSRATARDVEAAVLRDYSPRSGDRALGPRLDVQRYIADLDLPREPAEWTMCDVVTLTTRLAGGAAGAAAAAARLAGAELLMASCEELVECARMRLGPAVKVYAAIRALRRARRPQDQT